MPERDASAAVMEASATVLAFDFGTKRLGVAVGETMRPTHPNLRAS